MFRVSPSKGMENRPGWVLGWLLGELCQTWGALWVHGTGRPFPCSRDNDDEEEETYLWALVQQIHQPGVCLHASPTVPSLPPSQCVFLSMTPATQLFILLPLHHRVPVCLPAHLLLSLILGFNTRTPLRIHSTNPTRKTTMELGEPLDLSLSKIS